ncbi:ABC transporter permease [Hyphomicrobium sp.]|jgi:NitT/TauT family transport system permease protein|uniref:ABC transporter permease n=1 Tax=Hyphomicrobium sp. TaxID=82 RepID=UPI002BA35A1F|nr:ABC transporter permease [Hyphomicrobium sp.]HVZ04087.1 ABC transporter permease [Hyphomicrobium sp.]
MDAQTPGMSTKAVPEKVATKQKNNRKWAIRGSLTGRQYTLYALAGVLTPILIWAIVNEAAIVPKIFMPGPWDVIQRFYSWIVNEGFSGDLLISVQRVSLGFLAALVFALPLGLMAGTFKPAEAFLEPAMDFIRYMPAVAFVPLMMLWCGVGELSKVSIIFIGTFFQMVLMFGDDVRRVPLQQIEAAQTMGGTRWEIVSKVIFPSAAPALLTTCRITLGWAWTYLVVAEIVAANSGLGYAVLKAQRFLQTDKIFAGLIVIGILGLLQDQILRALHHVLFPYLRRH